MTSIGSSAFCGCRLTGVILPNSITSIGDRAFWGCALTRVTISDGVKSIGCGAFASCDDLTEVIIPASVTSIGNEAFCYGEATIYGEAGSEPQRYAEKNGFPFKAV